MELKIAQSDPSKFRIEFSTADMKIFQACRREREAKRLRDEGAKPSELNAHWRDYGESAAVAFEGTRKAMTNFQELFEFGRDNTANAITTISGSRFAFEDTSETYQRRYDLGQAAGVMAVQIETGLRELSGEIDLSDIVDTGMESVVALLEAEAIGQQPPAAS